MAALVAALIVAAGCGAGSNATLGRASDAEPTEDVLARSEPEGPTYRLVPPADPAALTIPDAGYSGWALLDRATGAISGSPNAETEANTVESMIKPWIVADYLRQLTEAGQTPPPEVLDELTLVIVDSNDPLAESYYYQAGADDTVRRLIVMCGLSGTRIDPGLWWSTTMTPVDAVRYGECVADGRAAGPQWTPWLLDVMTQVRGSVDQQISGTVQGGRWGIIDGLPPELAAEVSIKNGYTEYMDGWHVNCLAIHEDFVLAVMMRSWAGLAGAAEGCAFVARGLVVETSGD